MEITSFLCSNKSEMIKSDMINKILSCADKNTSDFTNNKIYIDFTNNVVHTGKPFGILRVEYGLAKELAKLGVIPVAWSENLRAFVKLPSDCIEEDTYRQAILCLDKTKVINKTDQGSILIVPACYWWFKEDYLRDLTSVVRQYRLRFIQLIHDVVWYKFAYWYSEQHVKNTCLSTCRIIRETAALLAYSKCSANDIMDFCEDFGLKDRQIKLLRPADEFSARNHAPQKAFYDLASGSGFVLFVSALQTRKNHRLLINLWSRLLTDLPENKVPKLIFVAHLGQETNWYKKEVEKNEILHDKVKLLTNIDDDEVHWLYENCIFTVFPSLYEGWGLPVGESLAHGKICIASDASSVPEIAAEYSDLIDPYDFPKWYERIKNYILQPEIRKEREKIVAGYKATTWRQSAEVLISRLTKSTLLPQSWQILPPDTIFNEFTEGLNERYFGTGWSKFDKSGVWSDTGEAYLLFRLSSIINSSVLIINLCIVDEAKTIEFEINSNVVGQFEFSDFKDIEFKLHLISENMASESDSDFQVKIKAFDSDRVKVPFCLKSFRIHSSVRPLRNDVLSELDILCPTLSPVIASLLSSRNDLYDLSAKPFGAYSLLFWAWRYGIGEIPMIGKLWKQIAQSLIKLQRNTSPKARIQGYTQLVDALWSIRPDLHKFSPDTENGQQHLVNWFKNQGIAEYNLYDIVI